MNPPQPSRPAPRQTPRATPAPAVYGPPKTSGLAIASLVCGLLGMSLPAIITGHMARTRIHRSRGAIGGAGMAMAGLILGYVFLGILVVAGGAGLAAPLILRQRYEADRVQCMQNVRQLGSALTKFESTYKSLPSDALTAGQSDFEGMTGPRVLDQVTVRSSFDYKPLLTLPARHAGNWLYYPRSTKTDKPSEIVLASPPIGNDRVILRFDNSVTTIPETEWHTLTLPRAIEIPAPVGKP